MYSPSTRIGPHNTDIISLFIGVLLGDGNMEKRQTLEKGSNYSIRFRQSIIHKDYIFYIYNLLLNSGYVSNKGPSFYTVTNKLNINKQNIMIVQEKTNLLLKDPNLNLAELHPKTKDYYGFAFKTYGFNNLDWLYDLFYKDNKKIITLDILNYITPISLAYLIMDDGG